MNTRSVCVAVNGAGRRLYRLCQCDPVCLSVSRHDDCARFPHNEPDVTRRDPERSTSPFSGFIAEKRAGVFSGFILAVSLQISLIHRPVIGRD